MNPEVELVGGVEHRAIIVVSADPAWPDAFARERKRILTALGERALRVDHVGSTSVPELPAKPLIDIDLSVAAVDAEATYLPDLEAAGYVLRVRQPGHRMVRTPELDVHVHICAAGSEWERRHLLFRDWLRHDPSDRQAYAEVKRTLAACGWPDMNAYAAAKGPMIGTITEHAEEWARATGWDVS